MKTMVLLTYSFPYGTVEAYLESEVRYYEGFDRIIICALGVTQDSLGHMRALPDERFTVIPIMNKSKIIKRLNGFRALFQGDYYKEIWKLLKEKRFSLKRIKSLTKFVSRACTEKKEIIEAIQKNNIELDGALFYAYRFEYQSYIAILLTEMFKGSKAIARAHRYDLYENENADGYIPLRERIMERLDQVYLISDHGKNYLSGCYPRYSGKMAVSRLGTMDNGYVETKLTGELLHIVSCSRVVPVKRLDRIVDTLAEIDTVKVKWTHYGDGPLLDSIKNKCEGLPINIEVEFPGNIDNARLMNLYAQNDYHVFINVSESEGVPVSIMEAMSFGIPCIATDVGGSKEIIDDRINGYVISGEFTTDILKNVIISIADMRPDEYKELRGRARIKWETVASADANYRKFNRTLLEYMNI